MSRRKIKPNENSALVAHKKKLFDAWTEEVKLASIQHNMGMGTVGMVAKEPPHGPARFVLVQFDDLCRRLQARHQTQIPAEMIGEFDQIFIDEKTYQIPAGFDVSAADTVAALKAEGLDAYINADGGVSWNVAPKTDTEA